MNIDDKELQEKIDKAFNTSVFNNPKLFDSSNLFKVLNVYKEDTNNSLFSNNSKKLKSKKYKNKKARIDYITDCSGRLFAYYLDYNILEDMNSQKIISKRQRNMYKALKLINLNKLEIYRKIKEKYSFINYTNN